MSDQVYIIGAGGFTSEITEYILSNNKHLKEQVEIMGYFDIDDTEYNRYGYKAPFLGNEREFNFEQGSKVIVTIADAALRLKISDFLVSKGCELYTFTHHNTFISEGGQVGDGAIICPYVTFTSNVKIGKSFQANIYSYVAHDCVIGDYVTFAPSVKCNGNIEIGDYAYIGTGAIIKQGRQGKPIRIGKNAMVGAGAMVTKSVPDGMTVFGNPAIEFTKENLKRRS